MIFEALHEASKRGELYVNAGGMCHFHYRRDGQITILEIIIIPCMQRRGFGRSFLLRLKEDYPQATSIFAKCPSDLPANDWYARRGFHNEGSETTRTGRRLNRWRLRI